jgi:hypothetical protein
MYELFKFDIVGNKYKITYLGDNPMFILFSVKLKGINIAVQSIRFEFKMKGHWFVPDLDYTGCVSLELKEFRTNKTLFEKIIDRSLNQKVKRQNIVCIGLNKTGTSSFVSSLQKLGFDKFLEAVAIQTISQDVHHGDLNSMFSTLENERYNLYNDVPYSFPKMYEKMYERRPDDVYVLTVRSDVSKWVKSVINFYPILKNKNVESWRDKSFMHTEFVNGETRYLLNHENPLYHSWGIEDTTNLEDKLSNVYLEHIEKTIQFFSNHKSNFIVVDVSKENELFRFCDWLNIKTENNNFEWVNKTIQ